MNRERLIKNMTDQVKEAQLKLGYAPETVRLYYPVASLNEILGTSAQDVYKRQPQYAGRCMYCQQRE